MRPTALLFAASFLVVILGLFAVQAVLGGGTKFCPWSHRASTDFNCKVKDDDGGRLLIEHHDVDVGTVTLSIYAQGKHLWIQHPVGKLKNFSNSLERNSSLFDNTGGGGLLVNGERFPIERLPQ
jgi:hypothetical protein